MEGRIVTGDMPLESTAETSLLPPLSSLLECRDVNKLSLQSTSIMMCRVKQGQSDEPSV